MKRFSVFNSVAAAVPAIYTAGQLALIDSKGVIVKAGSTGPYVDGETIDVIVGLPSGEVKVIGQLNPKNFSFKSSLFEDAVGKVTRVGYNGADGDIVFLDPTVETNITKFGTLTISVKNSGTKVQTPAWGDTFQRDVQIAAGDTAATIRTKVVTAATEIVAAINAKYGAGSVALASSTTAGQAYLQFTFAKGFLAFPIIDGIFTGTPVRDTTEPKPFISKLTGAAVVKQEEEGAIGDGFYPKQSGRWPMFDYSKYQLANSAVNYDGVTITTEMDQQYAIVDTPRVINHFNLVSQTGAGVLGQGVTDLVAVLTELYNNNMGLTEAAADALYAPQV